LGNKQVFGSQEEGQNETIDWDQKRTCLTAAIMMIITAKEEPI